MTHAMLALGLLFWTAFPEDSPEAKQPRGQLTRVRPPLVRAVADQRVTAVIPLAHLPAPDAADGVRQWSESEQQVAGRQTASVVPVTVRNCLLVSGSAEQIEAIRRLVHELDQPARQFRVTAVLVDVKLNEAPEDVAEEGRAQAGLNKMLEDWKQRGELAVIARSEIVALEEQPAQVQFAGRVPRVMGVSSSPRGRVKQVNMENVGSMLSVTGRVTEDDAVVLEINLERSHLGSEEESTVIAELDDEAEVRSPQVKIVNLQTTVTLFSGRATVVARSVVLRDATWREVTLLFQADILD